MPRSSCSWDCNYGLFYNHHVVHKRRTVRIRIPIGEILASLMLVGVIVSTPVMRQNYLFSCKVTVGKVNGLLTFGTLGYCLDLSNKTICSTPKIGYVFGQFLSNQPMLYYFIFCDFKDNPEVLAQNPQTAEIRTEIISISIVLAFLFATLYSLSKVASQLPMLWEDYEEGARERVSDPITGYIFQCFSSIALLSGIIGIIFSIATGNPISSVHTAAFALLTFTTSYFFLYKTHLNDFFEVVRFFIRPCRTICSRSDSHQPSPVLPLKPAAPRSSEDGVVDEGGTN